MYSYATYICTKCICLPVYTYKYIHRDTPHLHGIELETTSMQPLRIVWLSRPADAHFQADTASRSDSSSDGDFAEGGLVCASPSTQHFRFLVPKAVQGRVYRTRNLKYRVLGSTAVLMMNTMELEQCGSPFADVAEQMYICLYMYTGEYTYKCIDVHSYLYRHGYSS